MIRLEASEEDEVKLLETMRKYNEACNYVVQQTYNLKLTNKYKLHKQVYREIREIRERFGLGAQFVVR